MTHRQWLAEVKRLGKSRTPARAYTGLAGRVEQAIRTGLGDWHLVQTWHLMSLAQAAGGAHEDATETLRKMVGYQEILLTGCRRTLVSSASSAALHFLSVGDVASARTMVQRAEQVGRGLKPQEHLLREARSGLRAASRGPSVVRSGPPHMNAEDKAALGYARSWVRRAPGPETWSNLAAVYATRQPPDLKRARHWYRRAALKGHDRALFEYGLMLVQGGGGPKRPALGRRYLERAAALGQADARKVLAAGV
jgi:TPR repeat protein